MGGLLSYNTNFLLWWGSNHLIKTILTIKNSRMLLGTFHPETHIRLWYGKIMFNELAPLFHCHTNVIVLVYITKLFLINIASWLAVTQQSDCTAECWTLCYSNKVLLVHVDFPRTWFLRHTTHVLLLMKPAAATIWFHFPRSVIKFVLQRSSCQLISFYGS